MNKYKYGRKKLANWVDELKKTYRGISNDGLELLKKDLLAKKEPKEKCECKCHREDKYTTMCSFCCQNHKCNNCGGMGCQMCEPKEDRWNDEFSWYPKKKMTPKPQEELEVIEPLKALVMFDGCDPIYPKTPDIIDKVNQLIKAHNTLVKEIRELKRKPQGGISCGGEGFSNGGDFPLPNGRGHGGSITNPI